MKMENFDHAMNGLQQAFIRLEAWVKAHPQEWAADSALIANGNTVTLDFAEPPEVTALPLFVAPTYAEIVSTSDPLHIAPHDYLLY